MKEIFCASNDARCFAWIPKPGEFPAALPKLSLPLWHLLPPSYATRFIETTHGVISYTQLALLLAERVLRVLEDIDTADCKMAASRLLNENTSLFGHAQLQIELKPHAAVEAVAVFQETAPAYKTQAGKKTSQSRLPNVKKTEKKW